jgi:hypothetical protein
MTDAQMWRRLSGSERVALVCVVVALIGFLALPWLTEGGVSVTAIGLLVSGPTGLSPELTVSRTC